MGYSKYILNMDFEEQRTKRRQIKIRYPSGVLPPPRSACHLFSQSEQGRIIMYAGYSKEQVKKDVERGVTHSDLYILSLEDKRSTDTAPVKWKWQNSKPGGDKPSPRSGASSVQLSETRALLFGGVFDNEEDDENLESQFYNDQYILDLEKCRFHTLTLNGPKQAKDTQQKDAKDSAAGEPMEVDNSESVGASEETTPEQQQTEEIVHDDGVFTVRIGPSSSQTSAAGGEGGAAPASQAAAFVPNPRINCVLAHKQNTVYMYGGLYEPGDKQVTLDDCYSLDMSSMIEWRTLYQGTYDQQMWLESDDSDSDDDSDDMDDDDNSD